MEYITLNNGVEMPVLGYGTYQTSPRITERCVTDALRTGYRSIDTAQCYGNEHEVGLACKNSGIPRSELFIATKLWACHGYQDTLRSIDGSLKRIGMGYIDLLLIHEPTGNVLEIYRAMETAYKEGKLRAIGVSNFLEDRYLDLVNHCKVIPAVNQVETHIFRQQKKLRQLECQIGTKHESWSPLACGKNGIFTNRTLLSIAGNHRKSAAQVALRFLLQQGIIVIPKSTHRLKLLCDSCCSKGSSLSRSPHILSGWKKTLRLWILIWKPMKCGRSSSLKLAKACLAGGNFNNTSTGVRKLL